MKSQYYPELEENYSKVTITLIGLCAFALIGALYQCACRQTRPMPKVNIPDQLRRQAPPVIPKAEPPPPAPTPSETAASVTIATYNILNPLHAVRFKENVGLVEKARTYDAEALKKSTRGQGNWVKYSNWNERKHGIAENIRKADVVCLQEVTKETLAELAHLTGYTATILTEHAGRNPEETYGNAILYNSAKVTRLYDAYLQSENKQRSASCTNFQSVGKTFTVFSVHIEGYNLDDSDTERKQKAKERGDNELRWYLDSLSRNFFDCRCNAVVFAGDFNESVGEGEPNNRKSLTEQYGYTFDSNRKPTEPKKNRRIDWIGVMGKKGQKFHLENMNLEANQKIASDHLMTGTKITFV